MTDLDDVAPPGNALSSRHLRRDRLHDTLDGAAGHRCVLVIGPAGIGKTELLRAWCAEQPMVTFYDLAHDGPARLRPPVRSKTSMSMVLDNVHRASKTQLDDIIGLLAEPVGPRLVIAGRWVPPRLRACLPTAGSTEIDGSALALTEDETARLCARYGRLSPETLAEVYAVTGGWTAGAIVAATSIAGDPVGTGHQLHRLHAIGATLHDYVVGDVLAHLSDDDRRAVADTSSVETVSAALFTALTGRPDAGRLLEELARDGMFAVAVGERGWHRYCRLWRTALYLHAQHFEPDRLRSLHRTAGDWYLAHGRYREAVHHATAAGDHAHAAELTTRYRFHLLADGPLITVIPAPSPTWPVPLVAGNRPSRHAGPVTAVAGVLAQTAATARDAPDADAARHVVERAAPVIAALNAGRPLEARTHLIAWLRAAHQLGPLPHARALRHSAATELQLGNLQLAAARAGQTRRILADHGVSGAHDDGWATIVLAAVHIQRNELTAAAEQLRGLAVDLWRTDAPLTAAEHLHRAMIEQQRGDVQAALRTTRQLIETGTPSAELLHLHVQLLLANGHTIDAERHAQTYAVWLTDPLRRLVDAGLLLAQHRAAEATETLQTFVQHTDGSTLCRIDALLLLADAAAQTGHLEHATHLRRQAERIAAPAGIRRPFLLNPPQNTVDPGPPVRGPADRVPPATLTDRELDVLRLLNTLLTVAEIAAALHLTDNTVKSHVSGIYRKLKVRRRRDAVRLAYTLQLL
ncbi:LuxR C-terminal-related transcriptional regulator [Dactylosporangium cerinum]|uniref:LuxR C-terminal-related transcriptional regulator n=1 Tax=Dactylosporangium cerinum TaxID=1434730 RepID=A0ABV9W896_9ACTN